LNDSEKIWEFIIEPYHIKFEELNSKILLENYNKISCHVTIIERLSNNIISEKLCKPGMDNEFWSLSIHGGLWLPITIIKQEDEIIVKYGKDGDFTDNE
jgi:hypothetical protein